MQSIGSWLRSLVTPPVTVQVVGEASYQAALLAMFGPKRKDAANIMTVATLVPEPDNPEDKNAVAVQIKGRTVGYLSRPMAASYVGLGLGLRRNVPVRIKGGWRKSKGDEGFYGVELRIPADLAEKLDVG
ncbi:MAG: hypothetical protein EXR58_02870 [Chloroflexi bacterium]|nr:hypothetical protein [Chloroflexota bacterium]